MCPWRLAVVVSPLLFVLVACGGGASAEPAPLVDPLAAKGRQVFHQNCATCHALSPDTIIVGPSLAGIGEQAGSRVPDLDARQYLELSILKPDAYLVQEYADVMPRDFGKKLTGEELDVLVVFLLTLK